MSTVCATAKYCMTTLAPFTQLQSPVGLLILLFALISIPILVV